MRYVRPPSKLVEAAYSIASQSRKVGAHVARLTKLAQRRSLFEDPREEIASLTQHVKTAVESLTQQIATLRHYVDGAHGVRRAVLRCCTPRAAERSLTGRGAPPRRCRASAGSTGPSWWTRCATT